MLQAEGLRMISFRHEQNAGYAASIAGFLTQKPGICLTVSAPGFLNGLTALAHATTNCFPMILISGSSEREIVDLPAGRLRGDGPARDRQARWPRPLSGARGPGHRRRHRARHPRGGLGRPGGVYLDLPGQALRAVDGRRDRPQHAHQGGRSRPEADPGGRFGQARGGLPQGREEALIVLGKGAAYAQCDADVRALVEKTGIPYICMSMAKGLLPDTHEQSAAAARSYVLPEADVVMLIGARLNWLLSHGKGKTWGGKDHKAWGGQKFVQVDISPQEADSNVKIDAPVIGDIGSCVAAMLKEIGGGWQKPPAEWTGAINERKSKNIAKMAETLAKDPAPMNFHSALNVVRDIVKANPTRCW
jgi:oxalyl-CoA decarboxylase